MNEYEMCPKCRVEPDLKKMCRACQDHVADNKAAYMSMLENDEAYEGAIELEDSIYEDGVQS